jgi:hypothetical protein
MFLGFMSITHATIAAAGTSWVICDRVKNQNDV